jgi:hypothetical protein
MATLMKPIHQIALRLTTTTTLQIGRPLRMLAPARLTSHAREKRLNIRGKGRTVNVGDRRNWLMKLPKN